MVYPSQFITIIIFSFTSSVSYAAQSYCLFDADVKKIYSQIINLDLNQARNNLALKADTSLNKAYILMDNEIDFFNLFISEDKSEFQNKKSLKNKRLHLIEKSDLALEWKRFLKAEILLQWALIHLKQEEEFRAFQCIRESLNLLEENSVEFPEFKYTYKSLGILHTLMSTISEGFQWAVWLLGIKGNLFSGKLELQQYIQFAEPKQDLFLDESYAAMGFIISYLENKPEIGYHYWIKKTEKKKPNSLYAMIQTKLAIKAGFNDAVIKTIQSLDVSEKEKLPILYYFFGLSCLQKLDLNADQHFQNFLKFNKGVTYIKETYQKLAWIFLLKGQSGLYRLYVSNCLTKGNSYTDEDKQAQQEAASGIIPDSHLLKARLLFDGGYFQEAYDILMPKMGEFYSNPDKRLECAYRLGRICQMKNETDRALQFYNDVFHFDSENHSFMSSNALLQTGIILENRKKKEESYSYYQKVLKTNPDQYKRSIHQKAKAGLARLSL